MTARDTLQAANDAPRGDRIRRYEATCRPRGGCKHEPLANDPGRRTWCPDCLTVYHGYGEAVNPIPELRPRQALKTCPPTTH